MPFSRAVLGASLGGSTPSPTDAEEHAEAFCFALLPKQSLPEPQSKATHTDLPARGKLRPQGRSAGKSAGGSAIPSFHLLDAQLEMLTEGTAKWPVPLPEGMRAPRLLLDGQGVLWRARAQEHHRKLLLPGPPVCTGCVLLIVHQHLRMEDVLSLQAFPFARRLC